MVFDYRAAARKAGIPDDKADRLAALISAEFPADEMMVELHVLRAIQSVERGDTTLEEILGEEQTTPAA